MKLSLLPLCALLAASTASGANHYVFRKDPNGTLLWGPAADSNVLIKAHPGKHGALEEWHGDRLIDRRLLQKDGWYCHEREDSKTCHRSGGPQGTIEFRHSVGTTSAPRQFYLSKAALQQSVDSLSTGMACEDLDAIPTAPPWLTRFLDVSRGGGPRVTIRNCSRPGTISEADLRGHYQNAISSGLSCLARLGGRPAREGARLAAMLELSPAASLFCSNSGETPPLGCVGDDLEVTYSDILGAACLHGSDHFPGMLLNIGSISTLGWELIEPVIFHEMLHEIGFAHDMTDVDYPEFAPACCFSNDQEACALLQRNPSVQALITAFSTCANWPAATVA